MELPELPQHRSTTASPQHAPPVYTPPPEATQQDADSANKEASFGRPKLLSGTGEVVPSSAPTSPPASSPSAASQLPPSSLSAHASLVLSSHSSEKAPAPGSDTDDDESLPRVPSSNTPSPLKLPPEHSDPAARALHESISNLLGKRNAGAISSIEDHAEPPPRRKRARPRFKVSLRFSGHFSCSSRDRVFLRFTHTSVYTGGHHKYERWRERFLHPRSTGKYLHHIIRVRRRTRERDLNCSFRRAG